MVIVRNSFVLKGHVDKTSDWLTGWLQEVHSWDQSQVLSTDKPFLFLNDPYFLNHPWFGLSHSFKPCWKHVLFNFYNCLCVLHCHSPCSHNHHTSVTNKRAKIILFGVYSVSSENKLKFGFVQLWCSWAPFPEENVAALNTSYLLSKGMLKNSGVFYF